VKNVSPDEIRGSTLEHDLVALAPPPTLLPGESIERYQLMRRELIADIGPSSAIEWLLTFDVVELSWEIERYRLLRQKILVQYREQAVEQCLGRIDLLELSPRSDGPSRQQIRRNARCWRTDVKVAHEIEARLAAHGIDQSALNAECLVQAREFFLLFQELHDSAQSRRGALLREIKFHRSHTRHLNSGNRTRIDL